jgi:hypothetical protein
MQSSLKTGELPKVDADEILLREWYANQFYAGHMKYIITTNAKTLYSVISAGRGITNTGLYFKKIFDDIKSQMDFDEVVTEQNMKCYDAPEQIIISSTTSRSILGSMNDLIYQAKCMLPLIEIRDCARRLNETPMEIFGWKNPKEVMKKAQW